MLHALGLEHEHVREDASKFIALEKMNIQNNMISQFKSKPGVKSLTRDNVYDECSIMQYPANVRIF